MRDSFQEDCNEESQAVGLKSKKKKTSINILDFWQVNMGDAFGIVTGHTDIS